VGRITKATVDNAASPAAGQRLIRDSEQKGFGLRVTANGAKSFFWEGRINGINRRITLGQYPALSATAAREMALQTKAAVIQGLDPVRERKDKRKVVTFRELAAIYLEEHAKPHKRSWREDERRIKTHLLPRFGTRKLDDIRPEDVMRLKMAVERSSGPYEANRTLALLKTMYNLAHHWEAFKGENPVKRVKLFKEQKRERFLSEDEMRALLAAVEQESNLYWRAYFLLSLLFGTRKGELLSSRWVDFDLTSDSPTWHIPDTKAGRSHTLPITEQVKQILISLPSYGSSEFLFPGNSKSGHLTEPKKAWRRIKEKAGLSDLRLHDLRRTLGSWLAADNYSLLLIGRVLNHTSSTATQVYARLGLEPVRRALEAMGAKMLPASQQGALATPSPLPESTSFSRPD
jgi:integrase